MNTNPLNLERTPRPARFLSAEPGKKSGYPGIEHHHQAHLVSLSSQSLCNFISKQSFTTPSGKEIRAFWLKFLNPPEVNCRNLFHSVGTSQLGIRRQIDHHKRLIFPEFICQQSHARHTVQAEYGPS